MFKDLEKYDRYDIKDWGRDDDGTYHCCGFRFPANARHAYIGEGDMAFFTNEAGSVLAISR